MYRFFWRRIKYIESMLSHSSYTKRSSISWIPYAAVLGLASNYDSFDYYSSNSFPIKLKQFCSSFSSSPAQMCGLMGVVGKKQNAKEVLLEGLTVLQNRGYDSAGMCTIQQSKESNSKTNQFIISKYANSTSNNYGGSDSIMKLRREAEKHKKNTVGIAHTRWATQGAKIDANAHPHQDQHGRIAVVHNGSVLNAHEIRTRLHNYGILFRSDTDTEVIAQLIGYYMDQGHNVVKSTRLSLEELHGTWGLAILSKDSPDEIVVATHGSPIVIGIGENQTFVSSEVNAFARHAKDLLELDDGEIVVVKGDGSTIDRSHLRTKNSNTSQQEIFSNPHPWPHWTLREIEEQPEAIHRALNFGGRMTSYGVNMGGLSLQRSSMLSIESLTIIGSGSSYNSSLYGSWLMRSLGSFDTIQVAEASTFSSKQLGKQNSGLLVVSQSGETKSVLDALLQVKQLNNPCFSVVNSVGSRIAQITKIGSYQNAGTENAVTATKSFSTQVTVMALIACWFAQHRGNGSEEKINSLIEALQRLPTSFKSALSTHEKCKKIAKILEKAESCFVVGHGAASAIAAEGALKLKELGYLHTREWSGPEDDAPLALIESNNEKSRKSIPVIFIIMDDGTCDSLRLLAKQLYLRGTPVVIITDNPKIASGICTSSIVIPSTGLLTALVSIVPLQLIAYELALLRGYNPDVPRNLSKTIKD